jgi:dihydrodipicolinate synthase/N-acetylneuraminate lyase
MPRFPCCILATCVIPWDEQGEFLEDLFRHQVRVMAAQVSKQLYVFGTAGEGYAVTDSQFERIVRVFHDEMRSQQAEPMVGVISLSLPAILERIETARRIGVRQFQVSLPCWGAADAHDVFEFFAQVCGRFADCQFLHYNLLRSKRLVTPQEYARLAEAHPNLVATKNSTDAMERIFGLLTRAPQLTHFLTETGWAYGSLLGECGLLASLCLVRFQAARDYFQAGRRKDAGLLLEMQAELSNLVGDLMEAVGDSVHMDGAYDKLLWKLHDRRFPLRLLPPYRGASEACFEDFARRLEKYPRWRDG